MKEKGFVPLILLIVIGSVAIGVAYYLGTLKNSPEPRQMPSSSSTANITPISSPSLRPTSSPSNNLSVYTNTLYGYSISFPKTWKANANAAGGGAVAASANSYIVDIFDTKQVAKPYPDGVITIQGFQAMPSYDSSWTKSQVTVNELPATKLEKPDIESGYRGIVYLFQNTEGEYVEVLFRSGEGDPAITTFSQIISTFKLTG